MQTPDNESVAWLCNLSLMLCQTPLYVSKIVSHSLGVGWGGVDRFCVEEWNVP